MTRRSIALLYATVFVVCLAVGYVAYERFLTGETSPSPSVARQEQTGVRGLIVLPDDGRAPLINEIAAARETIDVFIYIISDAQIVTALVEAERRGVEVRVILEEHPYGGFGNPEEVASTLRSAGAEVKWSSSEFRFTHAKTLIFDARVVALLNLNLTRSAFETNREFGVISTWPADVSQALAIFNTDWNGEYDEIDGPLLISPTNSRVEIIQLIENAELTIDIYAEVIRDVEVVDELEAAERRGVQVRILLSPDNDPRWVTLSRELIDAGIEIRLSSDLYMHAKAMLVDGAKLYVGSQNFTMTSLDENRELGIIVVEPELVSRLESTFEQDFDAATLSS